VLKKEMNSERSPIRIAILDDYQNVALKMADWSALATRADITVFNDHIADQNAVVERLTPFDIVCVMRERTPLPREVLQRLPRLKLVASTGARNASIDTSAARELGIAVTDTGYKSTPTIELTWALILASVRSIARENEAVRDGLWQTSIGEELTGKALGVLGLGRIGGQVARIGLAFGMNVIAWSQNLTPEIAEASGAKLVPKDELFREADILTIHLILSARTRGLVGAAELALMKPTARLINTSRGPIVDELSLINTLRSHAIAGAAIDVFDQEPLPPQHPFRSMPNVLATPHIGYVSDSLYRTFYGDVVKSITTWLDEQAARPEKPAFLP
jgi:phosphoglycerate dehydrogenase-like enzyme